MRLPGELVSRDSFKDAPSGRHFFAKFVQDGFSQGKHFRGSSGKYIKPSVIGRQEKLGCALLRMRSVARQSNAFVTPDLRPGLQICRRYAPGLGV